MSNKKILFVITEYWYFLSHRKQLALFLIEKGYDVSILCKINSKSDILHIPNLKIINWNLKRSSKNVIFELGSLFKLVKIIINYNPIYIYSVGLKPILYTSIISKFFKNKLFIYAFAGMGSIFIGNNIINQIIRKFIFVVIKIFMKIENSKIIFQNMYDKKIFEKNINKKIPKKIIQGSGVDVNLYVPNENKKSSIKNVMLPCRFLKDKGVYDFIEVAKMVKSKISNVEFLLVGNEDVQNPSSIKIESLKKYEKLGLIKIIINQKKMLDIYNRVHLICFPSFREGLPKVLLEASSCEIPSVVYNVPGCNDIVFDNETGCIVEFRNIKEMAYKIIKLINNDKKLRDYGKAARKKIINKFSNKIILYQIFDEIQQF